MLDTDPTDSTSTTEGGADRPAPRKRAPRKTAKAAPQPATPPAAGNAAGDAPGAEPAAATPRKRTSRKATAAAGPPPATPPSAPTTPTEPTGTGGAATGPGPDGPAAAAAPARKTARKAAKKAAKKIAVSGSGEASVQTAEAEGEAAAPPAAPVKATRKRAARKAAGAAELGAGIAAPDSPAEAPDAGRAEPAMAPGVLFMAPPEAAAARKTAKKAARKAAAKKAGPQPDVEQPDVERPADGPTAQTGEAARTPAKKTARKTGRKSAAKAAGTTDTTVAEPAPAGDADPSTVEDVEDATADPEDVREAAIEQASGARRRRRRGRRGRGGARPDSDDDTDESADDTEADDAEAGDDDNADKQDDPAPGEGTSSTARRRRRRRTGSSDGDGGEVDDPPNTVTHVRNGRKKDGGDKSAGKGADDRSGGEKAGDDGVRGVKGSTRLEAKRQRRRDGRDTSRRRAPILTEAEFLARREAVDRVMAVRQNGERTQIAVLEDDILVEHYVTRASATSYVGNVYLGRVQNVLPSMEAAFIDIGKGRNGVLYAGEVNWDAAGLEGKSRAIEHALKGGDSVLVQVTKDPIGHKGARLTSQVSLPGRFLVLVPGGGMTGISRRLPDAERHRLKSILKKIVPEDAGVIVRTAAEGASEEDLTRDVERLTEQWAQIEQAAKQTKSAPTLVHGEPDLAIRVVRDVFNEDFKSLVVQGDDVWQTVSDYVGGVAPDLAQRVSRHTGTGDLFHELRVDEQLMKALDRKVWLPSGGSLVIDRTEAMTVVDVNTGKYVGSGGNLEQTVTRNNLEAAEEIVRQLRLRDVGGIVVIDFIDMVLESNRELVLRRLTECLGRDRTKHQVAEVTSLGLVQMTRKRVGEGLLEAFSETCETCNGRGVIVHTEPIDKQGGGSSDGDARSDDGAGRGKGKRRRSGRAASPAAPTDAEDLDPAALAEQRRAANAAIAAIHRAAAAERDGENGDEQGADGAGVADLDQLASGLVAAAKDRARPPAAPPEAEELAAATVAAVAQTEAPGAPAPGRRRRRAASRPAGPPGSG